MRHFIILTDEEINTLKNDGIVKTSFKPGDPYTRQVVYLTTQKGYEIDLKCLDDLEQGCGTCKYINKGICEEPCSSCDIRLGNNKWEPEEGEKDKDE